MYSDKLKTVRFKFYKSLFRFMLVKKFGMEQSQNNTFSSDNFLCPPQN